MPDLRVSGAIAYNAVVIFGFCHAAWFYIARAVPPVASSVSICMIPMLGLTSGSLLLNETLHWQDGVAILLIVAAIATVLWPPREARLPSVCEARSLSDCRNAYAKLSPTDS